MYMFDWFLGYCQGHPSPPEAMMRFPLFQIPPTSENFSDLVENLCNLTFFSKKFLGFHPPKFLTTFLVIDSKFRVPLFSLEHYISPLFWENYDFSLLFPPDLVKFTCFLHTLRVFHFPPSLSMMHLC